jgi:hypothetical protein
MRERDRGARVFVVATQYALATASNSGVPLRHSWPGRGRRRSMSDVSVTVAGRTRLDRSAARQINGLASTVALAV